MKINRIEIKCRIAQLNSILNLDQCQECSDLKCKPSQKINDLPILVIKRQKKNGQAHEHCFSRPLQHDNNVNCELLSKS